MENTENKNKCGFTGFVKKHKIILIAAAAVILAAAIALVICLSGGKWGTIDVQNQMTLNLDGYDGEGEFSINNGIALELDKTAMERYNELAFALFEEYYNYGITNYANISSLSESNQKDFYKLYDVAKNMTINVYQVTDEGDILLEPDSDDIYGGDLKNGDVIKIVADCPEEYYKKARIKLISSEGVFTVEGLS